VLQHGVQASQCLDKDVCSLVAELIATGDEEVQGLVQIKVNVAVGKT